MKQIKLKSLERFSTLTETYVAGKSYICNADIAEALLSKEVGGVQVFELEESEPKDVVVSEAPRKRAPRANKAKK